MSESLAQFLIAVLADYPDASWILLGLASWPVLTGGASFTPLARRRLLAQLGADVAGALGRRRAAPDAAPPTPRTTRPEERQR